jgi:FkbM family methyltransferase
LKSIKIVLGDLSTIFKHPYNTKNKLKALLRYFYYLTYKVSSKKQRLLDVWDNRKLNWYKDSVQSVWLMFNYIIDWEEFNLIKDRFKSNTVFIDVGANIGYYSIWASKFNPSGKIFSFEPGEINFKRLNENIACNNLFATIIPIQKAVAASSGIISMTAELDTLNHIVKSESKSNILNTLEADCISLDDFAKEENISFIDYLKIDVEGFELDVLIGAEKLLLEKKIGIIQMEINNALLHSGHTVDAMLDLLKKCSYILCSYDVNKKELQEIKYSENRENYFAVSPITFGKK